MIPKIPIKCEITLDALVSLTATGAIDNVKSLYGDAFRVKRGRIEYCQGDHAKGAKLLNEIAHSGNPIEVDKIDIGSKRPVGFSNWMDKINVKRVQLDPSTATEIDFSSYLKLKGLSYSSRFPVPHHLPVTLQELNCYHISNANFCRVLENCPDLVRVDAVVRVFTEDALLDICAVIADHRSIKYIRTVELAFPVTPYVMNNVLDAIGFHPTLRKFELEETYCDGSNVDYPGGYGEDLRRTIQSNQFITRRVIRPLLYAHKHLKAMDLVRKLWDYIGEPEKEKDEDSDSDSDDDDGSSNSDSS